MQQTLPQIKKAKISLVQSGGSVTKTFQTFQLNAKLFNVLKELDIFSHIINPWALNITTCKDLHNPLRNTLVELVLHPEKYKIYCPEVGTASYRYLLAFLKSYTSACATYPFAKIRVEFE